MWRGRERGASISAPVYLGPKKNPQLAVLASATPGLSRIPSPPGPTLGGPTAPLLHRPPHPRGDRGQARVGQLASTREGAAPQAHGGRKPLRGPRGWASQPWPPPAAAGAENMGPRQPTPGRAPRRKPLFIAHLQLPCCRRSPHPRRKHCPLHPSPPTPIHPWPSGP